FWCPTSTERVRWRGVTRIGQNGVLEHGGPNGDYAYNGVGRTGETQTSASPLRYGELGLGGIYLDFPRHNSTPLPESKVRVPSDMIAFADASQLAYDDIFRRSNGRVIHTGVAWLGAITLGGNPAEEDWRQLEKRANDRHRGKANVVFCDGHTESIKLPVFYGTSDEALRRWNNDNLPHKRW
ncbi:MAG: hypothetical protein L0Z50_39440, partial [Verrucomicrobiales bacterium]|nr:hypothetical protein [Verrucomicrobiales bacterium]